MSDKTAARVIIDSDSIQKLRKDWLGLASNVKRVRSIEDVRTVVQACGRWSEHLRELWVQITDDLHGRKRDPDLRANEGWIDHYLEKQKPLWDLRYEVGAVPGTPIVDYSTPERIRQRYQHTSLSQEEIEDIIEERPTREEEDKKEVERWQGEARRWAQRGRKKAILAWKWLNEFAEWTAQVGFYGGGGSSANWNLREKVLRRLEGFKTLLIGYEESENFHREQMQDLLRGLATYRKLASQRYPALLQHQLPLKVNFSGGIGTRGQQSAAATYNGDHIVMGVFSMMSDHRAVAHVLAHEMAHHIYQKVLSSKAREFWTQAIYGDFGPLDLREVMKKMKPNESFYRFGDRIEKSDPVLALQLEGLYDSPSFRSLDLSSIQSIQEALSSGALKPVIKVPKNPITGYATKNPQEAFCEAIGRLVAYGPRTVLPEVKRRIQIIVPNIKTGSEARLAQARLVGRFLRTGERLGPNTPLMEHEGAKVRYRMRSNTNGIAVTVYYGRTKIGGMNAYPESSPENTKSCGPDARKLREKFPQLEDTRFEQWVDSNGVERTNTRALQVYKAFITDESKHGLGIGKAMYKAVMAEWFDKVGPFLFMPYECSLNSGTSLMAQRVWKSLARDFPSSGSIIAILRRPTLPTGLKKASMREAAKFQKKKEVPKADGSGKTTVYEYSDDQIASRHREKAKKIEGLRQNLDKLRSQVKSDLKSKDEGTRLCALAVGLMNDTYERVGNDGSAKDGHFGVTGWQAKHVSFSGGKATISYVGKSGVTQKKTTSDASLVSGLKAALKGKSGSDSVFAGDKTTVDASAVNTYLKPHKITAKDIRGLHANREMQDQLKIQRSSGGILPTDKKKREQKLKAEFDKALAATASAVGHEAATLRSQYLVPGLEDDFMRDGTVKKQFTKKGAWVWKDAPRGLLYGYKVMNYDPQTRSVISGANSKLRFPLRKGVQRMPHPGIFLGGTKQYVLDYYAGNEFNALLTYTFDPDTVTSGSLSDREPEITVPSATVVGWEIIDEDGSPVRTAKASARKLAARWFVEDPLAERETTPVDTDKFCPVCGAKYDSQCRCFIGHRTCPNGHTWVRCRVHDVAFQMHVDTHGTEGLPSRRTATKDKGEKEREEVERLNRKNPPKKPPRKDLRRDRMKPDDDDVGGSGAGGDNDLSLNYKKVASLAERYCRFFIAGGEGPPEHPPGGPPWQSDDGKWVAKNKDGNTQTFGADEAGKAQAEAFASGKEVPDEEEAKAEEAKKKQQDRAQAKKVERNEAQAVAKNILSTTDIPKDIKDLAQALVDKASGPFMAAFHEETKNLRAQLEGGISASVMKEARKDPFKGIDKNNPEAIADALAMAVVRDRLLMNPSYVGGKPLSSEPLSEDERTGRAETAMEQFRHLSGDQREEIGRKAYLELRKHKPDSPEASELNAIIDGLQAAAALHGEDLEIIVGGGKLLREPLNSKLKALLKRMVQQGNVKTLFLSDPMQMYQAEGRKAVREAMGSLDDGSLAEMFQETPWSAVGDLLGDADIDPDVQDYLRSFMLDMGVNSMTTIQGLAASIARKKGDPVNSPEVYEKVMAELEAGTSDPIQSEIDDLMKKCIDKGGSPAECMEQKEERAQRAQRAQLGASVEAANKMDPDLDQGDVPVALATQVANGAPVAILEVKWEAEKPLEERKQEMLKKTQDQTERGQIQKMSPEEFTEYEKAKSTNKATPQ